MEKPLLHAPLQAIDDKEGDKVPQDLPFIVDAHVHVFPPRIFQSVWKWFDDYGWPIRYKLDAAEVLEFLLSRGVGHIIALQYAHKAGMADGLNDYMVRLCRKYSEQVTGLATVFPGEPGCEGILKRAFEAGLRGVKLHAHVQCFDMNSKEMDVIYETCVSNKKPVVMHVSREPKSPAYSCDPHTLCSADKLEAVIKNYPGLNVCVPHMGTDEYALYRRLVEKYDNLWLDTTMIYADYFPDSSPSPLHEWRSDRIMYGTDFPNIPYSWDREIKRILWKGLPEEFMERLLSKNAMDFFSIRSKSNS
ncbi:MAG: amidohydrolase [Deltaproteobacteria bacterium]|nr:amidohydrolase [Deltaproteobacteria bacterium]